MLQQQLLQNQKESHTLNSENTINSVRNAQEMAIFKQKVQMLESHNLSLQESLSFQKEHYNKL